MKEHRPQQENPRIRATNLIKRCGADFLITKSDEAIKAATAIHTYLNTVISSRNDLNWSLGFGVPKSFVPVGNTIPGSAFKEEKTIIGRPIDFPATPKAMMDILEKFLQDGVLPPVGKVGTNQSPNNTWRAKTENNPPVHKYSTEGSVRNEGIYNKDIILKNLSAYGFNSPLFRNVVNASEAMGVYTAKQILDWPECKNYK
jgi:hypothetical protein